jgi:hypothetical protein
VKLALSECESTQEFYHGWVVLGPGLTDELHDARVEAASDEHGLESVGALHEPFYDHHFRVEFRVSG